MGKKGGIARSFMMISQISISMLVPVFLCLFFGIKLNEWLGTVYFVPVFLFLGIGASIRNVYQLTRSFYAKDKKREDEELAYIENLKKAGERNKQRREERKRTEGKGE
ncbi:MAG: AtpZ/AtpI family protein [Lachnospiraceae bacterium]|nr:AtpZ/AtpI family protein [Lachnospiraceae bacterium]